MTFPPEEEDPPITTPLDLVTSRKLVNLGTPEQIAEFVQAGVVHPQPEQPDQAEPPPPAPLAPTAEESALTPARPRKKRKPKEGKMIWQNPALSYLKARDTLGLSARLWDPAKMRAYYELGKHLAVKMSARLLMVNGFDSMEQIAMAIKVGAEIANNELLPVGDRNAGAKTVALAVEAQVKLGDHLMVLAEKAADKAENERRKNLPPASTLVQVNVNGNSADVETDATNGQRRSALPPSPDAIELP